MTAINVELDKASFRTARECAFEARRAARRAEELAAEIIDVAVELGSMPAELMAALIATHQAQAAAQLAELAAVDNRVRDPYAAARKQFQLALRHEQTCVLALRRFSARIPNYQQLRALVVERKQLLREQMTTPQRFEADALTYTVSVDGEAAPITLRKDLIDLEQRPVPGQPN